MTATMQPWIPEETNPTRCWNFFIEGECCGFASLAKGEAAWNLNYESSSVGEALKIAPAVRAAFSAKYPDEAYTEWLMEPEAEREAVLDRELPGMRCSPLPSSVPVSS